MQAEVVRAANDVVQPPPSSLPADSRGANDLFEDVTAKLGLISSSNFATDHIANILESNGSGVVVFRL